ncbi:MAG: glutamine amidotransferase [Calditrichaeota bacterium]|nr:glutamine amidotransferase [Calditrichota bacterium]
MGKIVILKTGTTFHDLRRRYGDFERWVIQSSGVPEKEFKVIDVRQNKTLPRFNGIRAVIVTGSHAMVTEESDRMKQTAGFLQQARERSVPVLGICFGHQLLALAFGGEAGDNPKGDEFGAVKVTLTKEGGKDVLFRDRPSEFSAFMSHRQTVFKLPPGAINLAVTDMDKHAAFFLPPSIWGVQFHPEFNERIMSYYLKKHYNIPDSHIGNYLTPLNDKLNLIEHFLQTTSDYQLK